MILKIHNYMKNKNVTYQDGKDEAKAEGKVQNEKRRKVRVRWLSW